MLQTFLPIYLSRSCTILHTPIFRSILSTRGSKSDQPVAHIRKYYKNMNYHNFHTYPSYIVTHTDNFVTDKPNTLHGIEPYSHDWIENPNSAGLKTIFGGGGNWNVTINIALNKETFNQKRGVMQLITAVYPSRHPQNVRQNFTSIKILHNCGVTQQ